jgi:putative two-component system response regulator
VLAEAAADLPAFAPLIDPVFVRNLEDAAPLHDIGKAALPDGILNKPGPLTAEERARMETHTTIGAATLQAVADEHPFALGFLHTAVEIARSHHERWDGKGYPDRLSAETIPLSARILAVCDVYDALRAKRVYKAGMTHEEAVAVIVEKSTGHFDPALVTAFVNCADRLDRVFEEVGE